MSSRLVTPSELLLAPTGLDWATVAEKIGLVDVLPADAVNLIEQMQLIDDASQMVADYINQHQGIQSTSQTETLRLSRVAFMGTRCWVDAYGWLNFKTANLPVTAVQSMQWALAPAPFSWSPLVVGNASGTQIVKGTYPQQFTIVDTAFDWTVYKDTATYVQCQYTAGYPNSLLLATASAGSSVTLTLDSTLGMAATNPVNTEMLPWQSVLRIYDGALTEDVTVTSVTDATHVVVATLANTHTFSATNPIGVSALPKSIKQACILYCTHIAKVRGVQAMVMASARGQMAAKSANELESDAEFLLEPYVLKY